MTVTTLTILLAVTVAAGLAFAWLAVRRGRRSHAAEAAVLTVVRSWSEDGSSRGRVCAAAQLVARAEIAFLAEPSRRDDVIAITAASGATELLDLETPLDPESSILARALVRGEPIHVPRVADFPPGPATSSPAPRSGRGYLHPVLREDRILGVLALGWREEQPDLDPVRAELVDRLADEAARAIERDAHVNLLARQARTDELTALPNRRAWDEAVEREMARAERSGEPLCLALLDLDHFKAYNDLHGHPAGDAHLRGRRRRGGARCARSTSWPATAARSSACCCPSCDLEEAREVARPRARARPRRRVRLGRRRRATTARESADSLLARADAALYRAKHAGRATTVPA